MKETQEQEKLKGEGGDITGSGEAGQEGTSKVNISFCCTLAPPSFITIIFLTFVFAT